MDYGTHCKFSGCNALDFLPFKCDACEGIFCERHMTYEQHSCSNAYKKNRQVPVCPLCNIPVPILSHESADVKVNQHIDNDCRSDPALKKRSDLNRCVAKNCRKKDLTSIKCPDCRMTVCIKHRLPEDHDCSNQARLGRIPPQFRSTTPIALNSPRQVSASAKPVRSAPTPQRVSDVRGGNAGMSESEALQAALKLSAESARTTNTAVSSAPSAENNPSQEEMDLQLALLLQQEQYGDSQSLEGGNSSSYTSQQRRVTSTGPNNSNCNLM